MKEMTSVFTEFLRSKENGEDYRCSKGNVEMVFPSVNILKHAMSMYTIEAFLMFEKAFIDGATYNYKAIERGGVRVKDGQTLNLGTSNGKENVGCSSVWRMQMMRKMNSIITASQMNKNARAHCEQYCMELKKAIEFDVDSIHIDEDGQGKDSKLTTECAKSSRISSKRCPGLDVSSLKCLHMAYHRTNDELRVHQRILRQVNIKLLSYMARYDSYTKTIDSHAGTQDIHTPTALHLPSLASHSPPPLLPSSILFLLLSLPSLSIINIIINLLVTKRKWDCIFGYMMEKQRVN
ncbi:hypothetical protein Cgig2_015452 [Carnegiea gigantea]|uniref:Uncharacterized protein n=1 Tax=Carnegiea gigantea TaxID=171969 RepID=A0A9Q1JXS6_9CARY|nr:hypothetical protein Cgig2_015452 [Carnegiea gigantea]